MATTKKYDVAVRIGSYEKDGQTKNKYKNVGVVLEKEDGKMFMLIDRSFSPAGIINPEHKETVLLSFFEPKSKEVIAEPIKSSEEVTWTNS